jgi:hypothetical protein
VLPAARGSAAPRADHLVAAGALTVTTSSSPWYV